MRPRFVVAALLAAACSGGPTTISVDDAALGAALTKAGVLSGRMGGYASFALSQISKDSKLTLVGDGAGATSDFNAAAVVIIWDLHNTVAQFEVGWYNGVIAWNGLNVAEQTVDHMVTVGAAGSGNVVPPMPSVQIPVLSGTTIGEAVAYIKSPEAIYVGASGAYAVTAADFGNPKSCARASDSQIGFSCLVSIGTLSGTFNYAANRFSGTGGATITQPGVSFKLPAIQVNNLRELGTGCRAQGARDKRIQRTLIWYRSDEAGGYSLDVRTLESLEAWKVARSVAVSAYRLTLHSPLKNHYGAADQIRRAALSIPANVAEGYAQGTVPQMVRFTRIALGSATELKGHLVIVGELGLVDHAAITAVSTDCDRVVGLLIGLLKSMRARVSGTRR